MKGSIIYTLLAPQTQKLINEVRQMKCILSYIVTSTKRVIPLLESIRRKQYAIICLTKCPLVLKGARRTAVQDKVP